VAGGAIYSLPRLCGPHQTKTCSFSAHWPTAGAAVSTPSAGLADQKGAVHYLAPGFAPPAEFLASLRIGRARCLLAWMRYAEAVAELEQAVAVGNTLASEALFWLAAAYYFAQRDTPLPCAPGGTDQVIPALSPSVTAYAPRTSPKWEIMQN